MDSPGSHPAEALTQSVLDLITSGHFERGGWLRETEIASTLGVSRTPVRDALRQLAGAGVVIIEQHKGARLKSYSPEKIEEIYRTRALVESTVTAAAVPLLSPADLDHLRNLSAEMEAIRGDPQARSELARLNREFHAYIFARSGDHPLSSTAHHLLIPMIVTKVMHSYDDNRISRSMDEHEDLITAAENQDQEWAEAIMRAHILGGLSSYKRHIHQPGHEPQRWFKPS